MQWAGRDDVFFALTSGWQTQGIGSPNPFVNNYLLVAFLVPLEALFGAYGALVLFLFGSALAIVLAARKLAIAFGAHLILAMAAATFALFNPWTYTQIVAGHGAMLVAYAATMALVGEAIIPAPRAPVCALALAFTLPQLQFFVPAFVIAVALVIFRRRWFALATWLVAGGANALGIAFTGRSLASIPVTTAWEHVQSLQPLKALLLSGYFARYADGYDHWGAFAVGCVAGLAVIGCARAVHERAIAVTLALTGMALVVAMGIDGPLAAVFPVLVEHVPEAGLYRELYDLIGYVVIGYIVLGVAAAARFTLLTGVFGLAAFALLVLWAWHSPTQFWVDRRTLPVIPVIAAAHTRIALLPPFQPLSYRGGYSGLDPDAYPRPDGVTALNEAIPTWPGDAALATYLRDADTRPLAALSVSEIAARPWYSMTVRELGEQIALPLRGHALPLRASTPGGAAVVSVPATPELSLIPIPTTVSVASRIGAGAVFFGDVAGMRGGFALPQWVTYVRPKVVQPSRQFVHAADGWVDARLAFSSEPELAQPFGGAVTTSPTALLALPSTGKLLAYVRGVLAADDGRVVSKGTRGLLWIDVPAGVNAVRCRGLCEVVMQGDVPAGIPENASPPAPVGLAFRGAVPWLVSATLPSGTAAALRYNVRFDEQWECWGCPSGTLHVPIDATINAWLVPERAHPIAIQLVERVALVQSIAQAIGLLWILITIVLAVRVARNRAPAPPQAA